MANHLDHLLIPPPTTMTESPGPSAIGNLPFELLESILLLVVKDARLCCLEYRPESLCEVYRCGSMDQMLDFRLTSSSFRDASWRALAKVIGDTKFDVASRNSVENLKAISQSEQLAKWIHKLTITCQVARPPFPLDQLCISELITLENKDKLILEYRPEDLREDIKRELDGIKEQETQWYPETFSVWQDLHLDLSGDGDGPRFPMGLTLHPASECALVDTLVGYLRCFTKLNHACYSYQHDVMPARYRNLFRSVDSHKIHPESDPTERFALVNAHTGLEIFMGALAASNTTVTVRTMELAVETEEPDAFITGLPVDIVARACHKVENLVLKNSLQNYYKLQDEDDREPRIVLEESTFPILRSLTIDGFSANYFYGSSEYVPRLLPTAIPPISHLTIRANNPQADPLLQFLHRYAGHVHDLVFESVGGSCFTRVLGVLHSISLDRLEIRSRRSEDWRQYLEQAEGQKDWVMEALLQGMPRDSLLSSAKTVVLDPYFRQALDKHWQ